MTRNLRILTLGLWALTLLALAAMIVSGFYYRHQKQLELASTPDVRAASLQTLPAVPSFSLTDQNNQPFTSDDLKGQVWIADFIFTRCQGPCPLLTRKMAQVQKALANTPVKLLTITVDPAYDTPPVLKEYATRFGADERQWTMATAGDEARLQTLARALHIGVIPATDTQPILHSTYFILVDRQGKIRGYYSGEDDEAWRKLVADAAKVAKE